MDGSPSVWSMYGEQVERGIDWINPFRFSFFQSITSFPSPTTFFSHKLTSDTESGVYVARRSGRDYVGLYGDFCLSTNVSRGTKQSLIKVPQCNDSETIVSLSDGARRTLFL